MNTGIIKAGKIAINWNIMNEKSPVQKQQKIRWL